MLLRSILLLATFLLARAPMAKAQMPGCSELCVEVRTADRIDSLHVVIQDGLESESSPRPPNRMYQPRGLRMAAGLHRTPDTLTIPLRTEASEPLLIRVRDTQEPYTGEVQLPSGAGDPMAVELIPIECPT